MQKTKTKILLGLPKIDCRVTHARWRRAGKSRSGAEHGLRLDTQACEPEQAHEAGITKLANVLNGELTKFTFVYFFMFLH